jgi:hypothetical protein
MNPQLRQVNGINGVSANIDGLQPDVLPKDLHTGLAAFTVEGLLSRVKHDLLLVGSGVDTAHHDSWSGVGPIGLSTDLAIN